MEITVLIWGNSWLEFKIFKRLFPPKTSLFKQSDNKQRRPSALCLASTLYIHETTRQRTSPPADCCSIQK